MKISSRSLLKHVRIDLGKSSSLSQHPLALFHPDFGHGMFQLVHVDIIVISQRNCDGSLFDEIFTVHGQRHRVNERASLIAVGPRSAAHP